MSFFILEFFSNGPKKKAAVSTPATQPFHSMQVKAHTINSVIFCCSKQPDVLPYIITLNVKETKSVIHIFDIMKRRDMNAQHQVTLYTKGGRVKYKGQVNRVHEQASKRYVV